MLSAEKHLLFPGENQAKADPSLPLGMTSCWPFFSSC
jgi:hypothetical protein